MRSRLLILSLAVVVLVTAPSPAPAISLQDRDHLSAQEVDLIKDAQVLDKRIGVFVKAADRRLQVITGVLTGTAKEQKKDGELFGEMPTGSRHELVNDIAKILDEAITNIDDVSAHDAKNPLIPKALRILADEVTLIVAALRPLYAQAKDDAEIAYFERLIGNAEPILEAASKLPPPAPNEKKDKNKSDKAKAKT